VVIYVCTAELFACVYNTFLLSLGRRYRCNKQTNKQTNNDHFGKTFKINLPFTFANYWYFLTWQRQI